MAGTPANKDNVESEQSSTDGVAPLSITGKVHLEKYRLEGMTVEEREWRKKWLKDQVLSPREPILIPKDTPDLMNPIRRFYRKPLDVLFFKILPMKKINAQIFRYYTGKFLMGIYISYLGFYYFKYHTRGWESHAGWRLVQNRPAAFPGDPNYPTIQEKMRPDEYEDSGFHKSIFSGGKIDTTRTAAET